MIEWFRHDTDARNDIKIRKLLRDNDRASLGAYWMCVEIIYQNEGFVDEAALIEELSFYNMDEFIPALISLDLIERTADGKLTSKRVLSEIETNRRMAEVRSEKARKAINTRWHKNTSENDVIQSNTNVYGRIRNHTNHTTQHNTTQQNNITSLSKDSLVGGQQADTPAKNREETDLFGQKIELKSETEKVPYEEIGNYWNEKAVGKLPVLRELNDKRKALIKQRWAEYGKDVYTAIDKILASDSMVKWGKCGFDWLFQKSNMVKTLEGNYDNRPDAQSERNDFYGGKYIKGTNIRMDITASGDRSQYNPNDRLEDIL